MLRRHSQPSSAARIGSSVRFCGMSFAILKISQIDALFECLGPDFGNLRGACSLARKRSNGVNLYLEIIKWHCKNDMPDLLAILGFEPLGRIPCRCARCRVRVRTRQMWRFPPRESEPRPDAVPRRVLCYYCVVAEVRLAFARNPQLREACLISQAGVTIQQKKRFLQALVDRSLPGPHFRAALRTFGSEPVAFAIGIDHA